MSSSRTKKRQAFILNFLIQDDLSREENRGVGRYPEVSNLSICQSGRERNTEVDTLKSDLKNMQEMWDSKNLDNDEIIQLQKDVDALKEKFEKARK